MLCVVSVCSPLDRLQFGLWLSVYYLFWCGFLTMLDSCTMLTMVLLQCMWLCFRMM